MAERLPRARGEGARLAALAQWVRRARLLRGAALPACRPAATLIVGIASCVTPADPGLIVVRSLAGRLTGRADVRCVEADAWTAADDGELRAGSELIAIGEARLGAAPGMVTMLAGAAADRLLASPEYCEQGPALCTSLARLHYAGAVPARRAVLNIEPPPIASRYGPRFVTASVVRAAAEALALIETWRLLARVGEAPGAGAAR